MFPQLSDALIDMEEQNKELSRIMSAVKHDRVCGVIFTTLILITLSCYPMQPYVLFPERRVRDYSFEQAAEIEPQVTELLRLAEKSIKGLERKDASAKQKVPYFRS
jgi:hypothetical protein